MIKRFLIVVFIVTIVLSISYTLGAETTDLTNKSVKVVLSDIGAGLHRWFISIVIFIVGRVLFYYVKDGEIKSIN